LGIILGTTKCSEKFIPLYFRDNYFLILPKTFIVEEFGSEYYKVGLRPIPVKADVTGRGIPLSFIRRTTPSS